MNKHSLNFLLDLLKTPSPSGFETEIQKVVKRYVQKYADDVSVDVHGNLIAAVNPDAPVRVMLAGHCDQIGFMVHYIDDRGFLHFSSIGGIDSAVLPGTLVQIHTEKGPVDGVIAFKPVHLTPPEERGKGVDIKKLWIDIGLDAKEVKKIISVGDPVTWKLTPSILGEHTVCSAACDDKVGVFVVMEVL